MGQALEAILLEESTTILHGEPCSPPQGESSEGNRRVFFWILREIPPFMYAFTYNVIYH